MALELARTPDSTRQAVAAALRNPEVADDRRRDHVRIVTGPQPYRHAYYAADEFFTADPAAGVVRNVYGQRVLRVTGNFLRALTKAVTDSAGDGGAKVLYEIGRSWGEANIKEFAPRIAQEYEVDFEKMGMAMMLESWWWPLRAAGWGSWHYDFRHTRAGLVLIDLYQSAFAEALGKTGSFACHLYAGLFAAAFTHLAHRDLACVELACAAKGDDHCRFLVATSPRIEAATAQRDAGAGVDQIIEKLGSS